MSYCAAGEAEWTRCRCCGLTVSRRISAFKPYRAGNLLAGSILNLEPDINTKSALSSLIRTAALKRKTLSAKT